MYRINRQANRIEPLEQRSFGELGFRERAHLQEWIAQHPAVLGEELLILQKEFAGFSETSERLDLLALDKQGSLVIIENKLDDAGRDVTWQALKYASYCSGLSREGIRKIHQDYLDRFQPGVRSEDVLCEFLEADSFGELTLNKGVTQRVILVAARFRKEVTSTALWLMNFQIRIQCFRAIPYAMGEDVFLNVEQIIPTPDAEDFMIGLAQKAQEEVVGVEGEAGRHAIRREFWSLLLAEMGKSSERFRQIAPTRQNWLGIGSGVGGLAFNFAVAQTYGRIELYIDRGDKMENEAIFDDLFGRRAEIESAFGGALEWERLDARRACRIKHEREANVFERESWPNLIHDLADGMRRFEAALKGPIAAFRTQRRSQG